MAAVVLEDFYKPFFSKQLTEKQTYRLMKFTVVIMGAICIGMVFVVEQLGAVLQVNTFWNIISFTLPISIDYLLNKISVNHEHWGYSKWTIVGTVDYGHTSSLGKCQCKFDIIHTNTFRNKTNRCYLLILLR